jgi:hypothetical protein
MTARLSTDAAREMAIFAAQMRRLVTADTLVAINQKTVQN